MLPYTNMCWDPAGWIVLLQGDLGVSFWAASWPGARKVPLKQRSSAPWAAFGREHLEIKRDDHSSLFCLGEIHLYFCVKVWAPLVKRGTELLEGSPGNSHKIEKRIREFFIWGDAERAEIVQPVEEKAQHRPY